MTKQRVILVAGATGNVGRQIVSQLLGTGVAVRALARNPDAAILPDDVEVVRGDLSAPDTLDAPLDGVEAIFLVWPFLTAEAAPAVLDAATKHAHRIVYLSSMGVRDDREEQTNPIDAFHADIERLIKQAGLDWTFVRSGGMATNTLWWAPQIRAGGIVRWFHGDASRSLIHERDVAAVAARALTEDGHGGKTYRVTGPRALTQIEQMRAIGEAIGRPLRWEEVSPEAARQQLLAGMPPSVVDGILDAHAQFAAEPEPVTSTVEAITGAPARTFREWATDHVGDFC